MPKIKLTALLLFMAPGLYLMAQDEPKPVLDTLLDLKIITSAEISPDGQRVAFRTFENDFEVDKDIAQLWVVSVGAGKPRQLTYGEHSVGDFEWAPDGRTLAFIRDGKLAFMRADGGEAVAPELEVEGIGNLRFAPDGSSLYFTSGPKDKSLIEAREERYGSYNVVREDGGFKHIWRAALGENLDLSEEHEQLTEGREYSVVDFALSPNGETIVFSTWRSPHLVDLLAGRLYVLPATGGEAISLDDSPGVKSDIVWHTDGQRIAYTNGRTFPDSQSRVSLLAPVIGPH
jgi:dipeptidyl aminopeptidase/acylaminoacyl peptidase